MVIKQTNHIVDVIKNNKFTEQDLVTYLQLVPDGMEHPTLNLLSTATAFPELYGEDLPSAITYVGPELIDMDELEKTPYGYVQKYRAGSKNRKFDKIRRGIGRNGFKLKYPSIAVFRGFDGRLHIITGYTRREILELHHGFSNIIASVYVPSKGASKAAVADAVSRCGIRFNTIHDDADPTAPDDVKREVEHAIDQGWIDRDAPADEFLAAIYERIDDVCGNGVFTTTTRSGLAHEIFNNYNPDETVKGYTGVTDTKIFMKKAKLISTDKIKYVCLSSQNPNKTFMSVLATANQHPHHEIRLVFHNGTLEGYDLPKCWTERTELFREWFVGMLTQIGQVYFDGASPNFDRVKLYGVLPGLSSMHDLDKLVFIRDDGTTYQKDVVEETPSVLSVFYAQAAE